MQTEVQIYPPPQPRKDFLSWANFIWVLLTALVAVAVSWTTLQLNQSKVEQNLANFQSWAQEQKLERDAKILTEKTERQTGDADIKRDYVSKDQMKGVSDALERIESDTNYMRGRIDDLEVRKKNN